AGLGRRGLECGGYPGRHRGRRNVGRTARAAPARGGAAASGGRGMSGPITSPGASNRGRRKPGVARELLATGRAYVGPLIAIALITLVVCAGLVGGQRELDTRTTSAFQGYLRQHAATSAITATSTMTEGTSADLTQASAEVGKLLPAPASAYRDDGWVFSIPASISNLPTWLPSENPETSRTQ